MNVLILVVIVAAPLHVQDIPSGGAPPPAATEVPVTPGFAPIEDHQVYAAADFARLAPKNTLDMLRQVPRFAIRKSEELRGPGEATGNVLITVKRLSSKSDDIFTQLSRIPVTNVVRSEMSTARHSTCPAGRAGRRCHRIKGEF